MYGTNKEPLKVSLLESYFSLVYNNLKKFLNILWQINKKSTLIESK